MISYHRLVRTFPKNDMVVRKIKSLAWCMFFLWCLFAPWGGWRMFYYFGEITGSRWLGLVLGGIVYAASILVLAFRLFNKSKDSQNYT